MNEDYHNNKSIAIVDDEEDNVTLFTKVLQDNNYHVIGFTNKDKKDRKFVYSDSIYQTNCVHESILSFTI